MDPSYKVTWRVEADGSLHGYQNQPPTTYCKPKSELCAPVEALADCSDGKCACDGKGRTAYVTDPVSAYSGRSLLLEDDADVVGGVAGPLKFSRTYSSSADAWASSDVVTGAPTPFGSSPSNARSLHWWHSYYSAVYFEGSEWALRQPTGHLLRFVPCSGTPCTTQAASGNADAKERLQRTAAGFLLLKADGQRYVYESGWAASGQSVSRYFLTRIESRSGQPIATLTYALPRDALGALLSCPTSNTPAVPYLSHVQGTAGGFSFTYRKVGTACVLGQVLLDGDPTPAVAYAYAVDGSGTEQPGLLASAITASTSRSYAYSASAFTASVGGLPVVKHEYNSADGTVTNAVGGGEAWTMSEATLTACQPGSDCGGRKPHARAMVDTDAGTGDGRDAVSALTRVVETLPPGAVTQEARLYQTTDSCDGGAACSPGSERYEWASADGGLPGRLVGHKDKRGNWEAYQYAMGGPADGGTPQLEKRKVLRGALSPDGDGGVEETAYEYSYGPNDEQRPARELRRSTVDASVTVSTTYGYDSAGRQNAVIRMGYTSTSVENGDAGTPVPPSVHYLGTFTDYDSQGRATRVRGPCYVDSTTASGCPATDAPRTEYRYYADTAAGPLRNRLEWMHVYPQGDAGTPLSTHYKAYDARGSATQVEDANGVTTYLTYVNGQVATRRVGSSTAPATTNTYENGHLTSVQYPAGNFAVYCYRAGTTSSCTGGTPTDKLQWKAKAGAADGSGWAERVVYSYWPDGTVKQESYQVSNAGTAETRRVVRYAADAHRRPTWQGAGDADLPAALAATKSYDGADNLTGVGLAFNAPPALCNVDPATGMPKGNVDPATGMPKAKEERCSALAYDRANRLESVTEYPNAGTSQRTLFTYDAQGNVSGVKVGCAESDSYADCTQPAATYLHDDFGRIIQVSLPDASGPVRYVYDARGNMVEKQTAAMAAMPPTKPEAEYLAYSYDSLGRLKRAERRAVGSTAAPTLLYAFGHDSEGTVPANCAALDVATARTQGRVRYQSDSFGTTWYRYDEEGRVLAEVRVRTRATACSGLNTLYTYTANGSLQSLTYPYGRTVTYQYGLGGNADRITGVQVALRGGSGWTTEQLLSGVRWEPYGSLRGYTQHHTATGTTSTVEYALGKNSATSVSTCTPNTAPLDGTGRIQALRVSTGDAGTSAGDIYQRAYGWTADQVTSSATCVLQGTAHVESFDYDRTLRLTSATRMAGSAGAYASRVYAYNKRGLRTSGTVEDGAAVVPTYAPTPLVDRLLSVTSGSPGSLWGYNYAYDADGRALIKIWGPSDTGPGLFSVGFEYGPSASVATDTVFRAVSVGGAYYNYFYDARGRRRLKESPTGEKNEFFYDTGHQMLTDVGPTSPFVPTSSQEAGNDPPSTFTAEDYVWLDGRPVALVRSVLDSGYVQQSDGFGRCARNWDAAPCGVYFIVTDPLGKPVLMLDSSRRVTGVGEYDPFGHVNRVAVRAESPHPFEQGAPAMPLATLTQPTGSPQLAQRQRVLLHTLDLANNSVDISYVTQAGPQTLTMQGRGLGHVWSDWYYPETETTNVSVGDGCIEVCGGFDCYEQCESSPPVVIPPEGVVIEGYEYQRFQIGAQPFWTPLRFPGQYHDAETDLFENWNRYYDPSIGRYLQPEPMAKLDPKASAWPTYAYSKSNPVKNTDPTGLFKVSNPYECSNWNAAEWLALKWAGCLPDGTTDTSCQCQSALAACNGDGLCDVCAVLRRGTGPDAYFDDLGLIPRGYPMFTAPTGLYGTRAAESTIGWLSYTFNDHMCEDSSYIFDLASTILHEATHACSYTGVRGSRDTNTSQAFFFPPASGCSAQELEAKCMPKKRW
ncbi:MULTISPECIES: RHS repeat-associated core domain-containing protein [Myxococcaceae]|uniref:RHS repeat-associated core domain-containing protein n=1 Tax=Myxococcaceae TaxID=31 RepID=UPI00188EF2D6|nr:MULTISPECIES: RHS repeat-associated core domain-containing protein [Myxococcaceae]MBF5043014.1 RHS repeat-associated core domain-containing protein [Simulacricoccus sp. 17bor-14]